MNRRQITSAMVAGGAALALGRQAVHRSPALAGGWASLELVNPLQVAVVDVPVVIDAQVLGHGVHPSTGYPSAIRFVHEASGEDQLVRLEVLSETHAIARGEATLAAAGVYRMFTADMGPEIEIGRVEAVAAREGEVISQLHTASETAGDADSEPKESAGANEVMTDILDSSFADSSLEVAAGTTVTWVNTSAVVHQVAFEDDTFASSAMLHEGDTFSVTFDEPGAYAYLCPPHSHMTGVVEVVEA